MANDVNDEDSALFRAAMVKVLPLAPTKKISAKRGKPVAKLIKQPDELLIPDVELDTTISVAAVDARQSLYFKQPGVQPRQMQQLRTGKLPIEASLDLHGVTVAQGEQSLGLFLARNRSKGCRVIAIIHGKGHNSPEKHPPLKNMVHKFLRQYHFVLAFCSAPDSMGGNGATLVLLKRD
jgi:DNA-nicking Smr family endonuclease